MQSIVDLRNVTDSSPLAAHAFPYSVYFVFFESFIGHDPPIIAHFRGEKAAIFRMEMKRAPRGMKHKVRPDPGGGSRPGPAGFARAVTQAARCERTRRRALRKLQPSVREPSAPCGRA